MSDQILKEQQEYYQARASEYDEWFTRTGKYDHGKKFNAFWFKEVDEIKTALRATSVGDQIVELACGTGIWTEELAKRGAQITALDGSPEMLAINKSKVNQPHVRYKQVNLFEWKPEQKYDLVFASFWLSHVPPEKLSAHLKTIHAALKPGGRIFLIDSIRTKESSAKDQILPENNPILTRKLNDGREYQIVKVYYDITRFSQELIAAGFNAEIKQTNNFFWYATGIKI